MLNSEPTEPGTQDTPDHGSGGALALAGIATLIVVAIWFAFYFLVFLPRSGAP